MNINFKDKKTWLIIGAIVLVVVVVVIIIRRRKKKQEEENKDNNGGSGNSNTTTGGGFAEASYPLQPGSIGNYSAAKGSYGWQIKLIQKSLNDLEGKNLDVDGKFGNNTKNAIAVAVHQEFADGKIEEGEFDAMCTTFRLAYNQMFKTSYLTNEAFQEQFKK